MKRERKLGKKRKKEIKKLMNEERKKSIKREN